MTKVRSQPFYYVLLLRLFVPSVFVHPRQAPPDVSCQYLCTASRPLRLAFHSLISTIHVAMHTGRQQQRHQQDYLSYVQSFASSCMATGN